MNVTLRKEKKDKKEGICGKKVHFVYTNYGYWLRNITFIKKMF